MWCGEVSPEACNLVPTLASLYCLREEEGEVLIDCEEEEERLLKDH